jgi:hypothetical protein
MEQSSQTPPERSSREPRLQRARGRRPGIAGTKGFRRDRLGAVIAVAAAAGFLIWLVAIHDSGSSEPTPAAPSGKSIGPVATTESDLSGLAAKLDQPIYWAGSQPNPKLELTRTTTGEIYVRYLPPDEKIGEREKGYLTVATFPLDNAYDALKAVSQKPGEVVKQAPNHGLVVTKERSPTNVYIAYPGQGFQIEVYDPDPKRALSVATSGAVRSIG